MTGSVSGGTAVCKVLYPSWRLLSCATQTMHDLHDALAAPLSSLFAGCSIWCEQVLIQMPLCLVAIDWLLHILTHHFWYFST
jgi:hypothetical protein